MAPWLSSTSLLDDDPPDVKKQLAHRHPAGFVRRTLEDFNAGTLDALTAASHFGVSRSRLYELRGAFLRKRVDYGPKTSGGDRSEDWPAKTRCLLEEFLPLQNPPNYQVVADELERLWRFRRARSTVEAHVKTHYAHLVPSAAREPRVYRRFRREHGDRGLHVERSNQRSRLYQKCGGDVVSAQRRSVG
jgi:hypothetical protein